MADRQPLLLALPCPFCAHKPELERFYSTYIVGCNNLKCTAHARAYGTSEEDAVYKWNVRGGWDGS